MDMKLKRRHSRRWVAIWLSSVKPYGRSIGANWSAPRRLWSKGWAPLRPSGSIGLRFRLLQVCGICGASEGMWSMRAGAWIGRARGKELRRWIVRGCRWVRWQPLRDGLGRNWGRLSVGSCPSREMPPTRQSRACERIWRRRPVRRSSWSRVREAGAIALRRRSRTGRRAGSGDSPPRQSFVRDPNFNCRFLPRVAYRRKLSSRFRRARVNAKLGAGFFMGPLPRWVGWSPSSCRASRVASLRLISNTSWLRMCRAAHGRSSPSSSREWTPDMRPERRAFSTRRIEHVGG